MKRFIKAFLYGLILIVLSSLVGIVLYSIPYFIEREVNPLHWSITSKVIGILLCIGFIKFFTVVIVFAFITIITDDDFDNI
jgi:hypothetical protein